MKKIFTPDQKLRIALEAVKGITPINRIASEHAVHPNVIGQWKKILQEHGDALFTDKRRKENKEKDELIERLYKLIGQRDIELDWLKKKLHLES